MENERKRAPRFAGRRIEPARLACMVFGITERFDVRALVGAG
jgi:hypothetical protein